MAAAKRGGGGGGLGWFLVGIVFTLVVLFVGGWAYFKYGHPPVAVADAPFPMERTIVHTPLNARIAREMQQPPFGASEDAYEAGARVYATKCAACHGTPGQPVDFAQWMYPRAPQLWVKHKKGNVVGVSDDPLGKVFWKVKNGIRLTGMPAFEHVLSDDQMWDVTLLLHAANQPLPDPVKALLTSK